MERSLLSTYYFIVISLTGLTAVAADRLQCKNPNGKPVDWYAAIKLPNLKSNVSDGTGYIYMDTKNIEWTYLTGITTEESAIGHTVAQIYAPTESYNNSLMWIVYNDSPTNGNVTFTLGHSKGTLAADKSSGFWLVHSVPKFPQLPYQNNNTYTYPRTGLLFGQSFLCISMTAEELDKVGNQLINNEVQVYGSHFGDDLKKTFPTLYNATLPYESPTKDNDGVRLQNLRSIEGFNFLSISKNRNFNKDLYADLVTQLTHSSLYTETWRNSPTILKSNCSGQYKTMNIESLSLIDVKGLEILKYNTNRDHSKWAVTTQSVLPWICIGDVNRDLDQLSRGGGTVCINSFTMWSKYRKLIWNTENCKSRGLKISF